MPIDPVKIPQNVYVEDRIVGPVTLRQLIILLLTGGFSYMIWTGIKNQTGYASIPVTVLCWTPLLIGAAFAFVRIQEISLLKFILLQFEKLEKPLIRSWSPRRGVSINFKFVSDATEAKEKGPKTPVIQPHREKLEELSAMLDQGPLMSEPDTRRPVDRNRVRVSVPQGSSPLDDIIEKTPSPSPHAPAAAPLLHDILPPNTQSTNQ